MSLIFIHDFQNKLYEALSEDEFLSQNIKKIYMGVVQEADSPSLLIKIQNADLVLESIDAIYSIEFEISAYGKDRNYQILTKIADRVVYIIENIQNHFSNYIIAGVKANKVSFEKAKDLVLNKLAISFKALIKEVGVWE